MALNASKSLSDPANLRIVSEAVPLFPGSDFQEHYSNYQEHSLLSSTELNSACKLMYDYVVKVADSIEKCFPEADFMISNTAFLDPSLRSLQQPDLHALINRLINRFSQGGPVVLSFDVILMQFHMYQNDCSIDMIFSLGN